MKGIHNIVLASAVLLLSPVIFPSCESTSNSSPLWFTDEGMEESFPSANFIRERGEGLSKQDAENDAVSYISRYFETEASVSSVSRLSAVQTEDSSTVINTTELSTEIKSNMKLFGIRFTEPYFLKNQNKYYVVAYIDREEAWTQYKPLVDGAKSEFYAMKKNAEKETDSFKKCLALKKVQGSGDAFLDKLMFARALNAKKEAAYSQDRKSVSEIAATLSSEQSMFTISIEVTGDYGNIISSSLSKSLSKKGFKISKSAANADYNATAEIEDNATGTEPLAIYPSLDFKITDKSGSTVFSTECKLEKKTVAYTLENAQAKAYPLLAQEADKAITESISQ